MPDYTMPTGTSSTMTIRDNGSTVEFWLTVPGSSYGSNIPWAFTVNGRTEWREFDPPDTTGPAPETRTHQFLTIDVPYSQTIGFQIADTNNAAIGGPTDFFQYITRGAGGAGVTLQVGNELKKAIPYINVNGVWKVAEPWSKIAGEWKQTN